MRLFSGGLMFLLVALAWTGCSTSKKSAPTPEPVLPAIVLRPPAPEPPQLTNHLASPKTNPVPQTNIVTAPLVTNARPIVAATNVPPTNLPVKPRPLPRVEYFPEWVEMRNWSSNSGLARLDQLEIGGAYPRFTLRSARGDIDFTVKSQTAHWKGMAFMLGFAPQIANGRPYVHGLDVQHSILPLLRSCDCAPQTNKILVIDPGHGGDQPGSHTVIGNRSEKELTLDWALRVQSLVADQGWKVYLTRTNDTDVALTNRVALADSLHADLFISLHFNSLPNHDQSGLETYCLTPAGMPSNLVRGAEDQLSQPNNAYDSENLCWALQLHRELVRATRASDRGVRRARFPAVLRTQKRPAILIEGGYLSNPKEASQIITESYRQKLAEGVAKALLKK